MLRKSAAIVLGLALGTVVMSGVVMAQQSPVDRAVYLALQMQKLGVELQQLAADFAQAQRHLAETERLCGDKCAKPAGEPK